MLHAYSQMRKKIVEDEENEEMAFPPPIPSTKNLRVMGSLFTEPF